MRLDEDEGPVKALWVGYALHDVSSAAMESMSVAMACLAAGARPRAQTVFDSIQRFQVEDGSWWTGYVFPDNVHWPDERPTWTAAAVLLAADALHALTPASRLFVDHHP